MNSSLKYVPEEAFEQEGYRVGLEAPAQFLYPMDRSPGNFEDLRFYLERLKDKRFKIYKVRFSKLDEGRWQVNLTHTLGRKWSIFTKGYLRGMFGGCATIQGEPAITEVSVTVELLESARLRMVSVLFLAADPTDASRLRLGEEFREIQEKLKLAKLRDRFRLELPQLSARPADISQALLDVQPQIVHFSGHGTSTGALCFENRAGQTHLVQPDALASLFEQFANQVDCALLNACYSENQAKAIAEHIKYVIGMNQAIGDKAAIAFAIGFYQALGAGRTIEDAYKLGCVQIRLQDIPEHLTPVLIKKEQMQQ